MFAWEAKKIKTTKLNEQDGRHIIVEVSAKDIVQAPNRHRTESILSAICVVLTELISIQEAQAARIRAMLEAKNGSTGGNTQEVPRDENAGVQH